ncbi:putative phage tail protein [Paenibacillus sp. FSL R5-0407]|uniref:putative phage tail protein n=1 Tax=Paenibacillus sp. FSL R5-0407 TaxID=2975320 RepID=UPI0030FCE1A0
MLDYLPRYYGDSRTVRNLTAQEAEEIIQLQDRIQDVLRQFFVDTAVWGLSYWENVCGIPVDENKPKEQRRSVIKSKLRGAGTVTLAVIKNVVDSFENGEIQLQENFAKYEVVITFIGKRGVPPNLNDVRTALREIVPAHLSIRFEYTYLRWEELDKANLNWDELEALSMTWDQLEVWKPEEKKL